MKKRESRVRAINKVIVGVLAAVILCGVWAANAFAYNIITTAPTDEQHKAYFDARKTRTPQIEDGKYVYTLQINIAKDRWGIDRTIGGEQRKVDERYVTEFINRLNEIYAANDMKVKFKANDIYLCNEVETHGQIYGVFTEQTYYAGYNDMVVNLIPEKAEEVHGRSYYSGLGCSKIFIEPSNDETTGYNAQVLAHEMSHYRGMQDTYFNNVQVNEVNGELRRTSYDGIMNYTKTIFEQYEKAVLNYYASQPVIRGLNPKVGSDYPAKNYFQVLDNNGQPMANAEVKVYNSELYGNGPFAKIASIPSWTGTTDGQGKVLLAGKAQPGPGYPAFWIGGNIPPFKVQLIEIKANGQTKYGWMELEDYHCAYWNGHTSSYTWKVDFNKGEITNKLEAPAEIVFQPRPDGTLIWGPDGKFYLIKNGEKRPFASAEVMAKLGYSYMDSMWLDNIEFNRYPTGDAITLPPPPPDATYYTVQSGDYLARIAAKLGVDWRELARVNGISSPYVIYVGQRLIIPGVTPPPPPPDQTYYTVQSGDYLSKIAAKLGVDWGELARVNGISSPYIIHVGQRLIIPGVTPPPPPPDVTYYTVQSGDYLSKIAAKLGVDWGELARVNGISSPYIIYVGQRLIIPGVSGAPITKIDPFKFGLLDQKVVPLEEHLEYAGTGERVKPGEAYEEATRALGEAKSLITTGAEGSTVEAIKKLEEETLKYHMGGKAEK